MQLLKNFRPTNILCIQLRKIGDVLMTTPAVRALKMQFPDAKISFLTEPPSDEIFRNSPFVDEILCYNRKYKLHEHIKFIQGLRKKRFDLVIDFFCNPRSTQIAFLSGAKYRIGFNFRGRSVFYTHKISLIDVREAYSPFHKLALLAPLGIEAKNCKIEFPCSAQDYQYAEHLITKWKITKNDFVIALYPASKHKECAWPVKNFAWVADNLIETYSAKILFICGPGEEEFINGVKHSMQRVDMTIMDDKIPALSLAQLRALFEKIDLYIGNDSGLAHIAISAGTPTVRVFGQPDPSNWMPPENMLHKFVEYDPECKKSCNFKKCRQYRCITDVDKKIYLHKIMELIEELGMVQKRRNSTP